MHNYIKIVDGVAVASGRLKKIPNIGGYVDAATLPGVSVGDVLDGSGNWIKPAPVIIPQLFTSYPAIFSAFNDTELKKVIGEAVKSNAVDIFLQRARLTPSAQVEINGAGFKAFIARLESQNIITAKQAGELGGV